MSGDFDPDETRQTDLRGGKAPWGGRGTPPQRRRMTESLTADVLVVGAGITGSMAAQHLAARGLNVVVIDDERPGLGSTAASTAMLQWEIDRSLTEMTGFYGFDQASLVYRHSIAAMNGLTRLVHGLGLDCDYRARETLYLAAGDVGHAQLAQEHALRRRAGLPGDLLDGAELRSRFDLRRDGAILSPGSADADPMLMSWGLLHDAQAQGARLFDARAQAYDPSSSRVTVGLEDGLEIQARNVILATGYVMPDFVTADMHSTVSSWAIATRPQPADRLWPGGALIWEASEDYHYLRTLADGRIVIGGGDDEIVDPQARDAMMPEKQAHLVRTLANLWPAAEPVVDYAWSGAFGTTEDGLPLIGPVPGMKGIFAAYGYGGNGITFSFMASRILAELCAGNNQEWFSTFAIDRPPIEREQAAAPRPAA